MQSARGQLKCLGRINFDFIFAGRPVAQGKDAFLGRPSGPAVDLAVVRQAPELVGVPERFRIGAAGGNGKTGRQRGKFLEDIFHRETLFEARPHELAEFCFDVLADDEHQLAETRAGCRKRNNP